MATTVYEIPLVSVPQTLNITLSGTQYTLLVYWCWPMGAWIMEISLASTGAAIAQGIPLVTGVDLLGQLAYLGIPGQLIVQTDNDTLAQPTFDNLGTTAHLYYIPAA